MARGYSVGNVPPQVAWTIVRGDTAAFKVYVTDDAKSALTIPEWTISMKVKRPNLAINLGVITDDATTILTLSPLPDADDLAGEFTVSLTSAQSNLLQTGDIFDIQLSQPDTVWTVAQGRLIVIEDVTD
jgi:hypothetical protein